MKIIIFILILFLGSCITSGYRIYNTILLESHFENTYKIYSGIEYLEFPFEIRTIEYQIYPCFKGSLQECSNQLVSNNIILSNLLRTKYMN